MLAPSTAPQALSHVPLTEHLPPPPLRPLLAAVRASPKSLPCECAARRTRPPVQRELRRGPAVLKVVHACALAAMPAALAAWGDRTKTAMARGPRCFQIPLNVSHRLRFTCMGDGTLSLYSRRTCTYGHRYSCTVPLLPLRCPASALIITASTAIAVAAASAALCNWTYPYYLPPPRCSLICSR